MTGNTSEGDNTVGKGVTSNFSFSHSVFKRLVLKTLETRACLEKVKSL